jgi:hypothetical protein
LHPSASYCTRFFKHICSPPPVRVLLYSLFHTHLPAPTRSRPIVLAFSYTSVRPRPSTPYCTRFFTHICTCRGDYRGEIRCNVPKLVVGENYSGEIRCNVPKLVVGGKYSGEIRCNVPKLVVGGNYSGEIRYKVPKSVVGRNYSGKVRYNASKPAHGAAYGGVTSGGGLPQRRAVSFVPIIGEKRTFLLENPACAPKR